MVVDAVQSYVNLANAVTRAARARAVAVARGVLAQAGLEEAAADANDRATRLGEEARAARQANRELVETLVATEVTRAASRFGFVRSDDLDEVREEIAELRAQLKKTQQTRPAARKAGAATPRKSTTGAAAQASPATAPPARKAAAKRSAAKKSEQADGADLAADPATDGDA